MLRNTKALRAITPLPAAGGVGGGAAGGGEPGRYNRAVPTYEHIRILIWVFGIPTILALLVRAIRKAREIRRRHEELLEEEKANPQQAFAQLSQLYSQPKKR